MRTITLDHLTGSNFSYTPAVACSFDVVRANRSAAVPRPTEFAVHAGPSAPLVLSPGDAITLPETEEFLDHLVASGQAHVTAQSTEEEETSHAE